MLRVLVVVLSIACWGLPISAQLDGWKMTDRFYGFRYELTGRFDVNSEDNITKFADSEACFGWVQRTETGKLVGEGRCSKLRGPRFQDYLAKFPGIEDKEFLIYSDTKLRLHFSSFKILETTRETCFLDKPHKCKQVAQNCENNSMYCEAL